MPKRGPKVEAPAGDLSGRPIVDDDSYASGGGLDPSRASIALEDAFESRQTRRPTGSRGDVSPDDPESIVVIPPLRGRQVEIDVERRLGHYDRESSGPYEEGQDLAGICFDPTGTFVCVICPLSVICG
ncbi:hypothetical protein LXA43DRAFT_1103215 [Ganoderma leucocontextum]|nr:hypothetical protein LXA43DRAFT_1103215 [Ganoderma leucocontextum]